ncbi:MAG: CapA family protein [Streptosporangiaceae bacterium]
MKTLTAASLVAASALLAVSCSSSADNSTAQGDIRSEPAKAAPAAQEPKPVKQPIVIAFGGDVHFEGSLRGRLSSPSTTLGPIASTLRKADFAMVNLETAITQGGVPAPGKEFHFRAPISAFPALKAAGVDVVTEANNHGMDFMEPGLADTLKAIRKSRFPVVGIGKDADAAYGAYRTTVKGNKIAVVGATQVLDDNLIPAWTATDAKGGLASAKVVPRMIQSVRDARKGSDVVIVYLHWGQELAACPLPRQQELADQLVAAGADIVVGSHAHVPLGGGFHKGRYVHYGLGNFVFSSASGQTANSGVLLLRVEGRKVSKAVWKPARISGGLPRLLTGAAGKAELKRWTGLRRCAGLS